MEHAIRLAFTERRFTELVWDHEPLPSGELAKLAEEALGWKRTTSYTVLTRLQKRGILVNENGTVHSLISKKEYLSKIGEEFLEESFGGSLPSFVAAFSSGKKLNASEIAELKKIIDAFEEKTS